MRPEIDLKDHSYEELRAEMLEVIAGRRGDRLRPDQLDKVKTRIAEIFAERDNLGMSSADVFKGEWPRLSYLDSQYCDEVFWDLFLDRIVTIGADDSNRDFPYFRLTHSGAERLKNQGVYFFHDLATYEKLLTAQVPKIDPVTLIYAKEAMQAFRSGCLLSASVAIGVATEHVFELLLEAVENNPAFQPKYAAVFKETRILPKVNKFQSILENNLGDLARDVREDLHTHFAGILSLIRTFRNESGHPTGKIIDREQMFVLLQLFPTYAKKMHQLIDVFAVP